jgi:hypothetical protein
MKDWFPIIQESVNFKEGYPLDNLFVAYRLRTLFLHFHDFF